MTKIYVWSVLRVDHNKQNVGLPLANLGNDVKIGVKSTLIKTLLFTVTIQLWVIDVHLCRGCYQHWIIHWSALSLVATRAELQCWRLESRSDAGYRPGVRCCCCFGWRLSAQSWENSNNWAELWTLPLYLLLLWRPSNWLFTTLCWIKLNKISKITEKLFSKQQWSC